MALSDPPVYHIGIVVSDLEAAKTHLTELLGITWGNNTDIKVNGVRDGDGHDSEVPFFLCYSREEPHIELVQEVPGTIWERNEHSNLHHLGVWSDAVPRTPPPCRRPAARCSSPVARATARRRSGCTTATSSASTSSSSTRRRRRCRSSTCSGPRGG